ncbi:MAG: hypothetical protein H6Q43_2179 [Deltaproteobacteria bacterium]|nr:hypothetical protein [Deltaproteobacteria bacterium]
MQKRHNSKRKILLVAIPLFLLLQVAVHDHHHISHIDSFSDCQCFENAHPEDEAANGPERWWILESNTRESFILSTANPFSKSSLQTAINISAKRSATLRC